MDGSTGKKSAKTTANKNPSIRDIAREAGVTISTVSNVLNQSKFVTKATSEKVLQAVRKLDYHPNKIARSLRTRTSETIGVIVPDIKNPFYAIIIQEMERMARQRGYTLLLGCTFFDDREEEYQMRILMNQFVDGLVFFGGYDSPENLLYAQERDIPFLVLDREIEDTAFPAVLVDNVTATAEAVDHLVAAGHREIGFVTFGYERQTVVRRRFEGYKRGLQRNNIPYNPDFVVIDEALKLRETAGTYQAVLSEFAQKPLPTAFITLSDVFAYGLIGGLEELGYKVPQDISVIGFCDNRIGEFIKPKLTTIVQPMEKMGSTAMSILLDLIEGKKIEEPRVVYRTELLSRDTVAPPSENILNKHITITPEKSI